MRLFRAAMLCLVSLSLAAPAMSAGRELRMSPSNIPPKIREAAEGAVPGIKLDAVKVERAKAGIVYEVAGNADGKRYELEITPQGEVLEVEESDGIALDSVPEAARKAALEALPGATLVEAELLPSRKADTPAVYLLEAVKDGKEYEIQVTAKGLVKKVVEDKGDKDDDD